MSQRPSSIPVIELQSAIRRTIHNDKIVVKNVVTTIPSLAGEHFLSEVELCDVEIDDEGERKQVNLFIKKEISEEIRVKGLPTTAFDREIMVYDVLLRDIVEFCQKNEKTHIDTDFFPVFFSAGLIGKEKYLVLENLVISGYKMHDDKMARHSLIQANMVMKALATLHAATYVMQVKTGVALDEIYDLHSVNDESTTALQTMVNTAVSGAVTVLQDMPECSEIAGKLRKFEPHAWKKFLLYYQPWNGKIKVVCHSDCWNNNILFLKDERGNHIKVKLVDWQITHCGMIGKDICHYLYTAVNPEIRQKRTPEILRAYFNHFSTVVVSLGAEDALFSYEKFLKEYSKAKLFGLIMGSVSVTFSPLAELADEINKPGENGHQKFDLDDLNRTARNFDLTNVLSEVMKNELIDIVKGCQEELDVYLSSV